MHSAMLKHVVDVGDEQALKLAMTGRVDNGGLSRSRQGRGHLLGLFVRTVTLC